MGGSEPAEITVKRVGWSDTLAGHVAQVAWPDPTIDPIAHYKGEVEAGRAIAYGVFVGDEHCASIVSVIFEGGLSSEWVVCVAASSARGKRLLTKGFAAVEHFARQAGCSVIRFQTARTGLVAMAAQAGFSMDEVILRKAI